jgi:hypothetical protein
MLQKRDFNGNSHGYRRVMKTRSGFRQFRFPLFLLTVTVFIGFSLPGFAQEKVVLKEVKIAGNLRVEEDGIRLPAPPEAIRQAALTRCQGDLSNGFL